MQTLDQLLLQISYTPHVSEADELRNYIDERLENILGHKIDDEKLAVLLKKNKNIITKSCPGSGKSELVLYKLFLLINKEKIKPNEILVLSFNKNVSRTLQERAKNQFGLTDCNIMTFHSLAFKILKPHSKILYDQRDSYKDLSVFTQGVARSYLNEIGFRYNYRQLLRLTKLAVQFIGRIKKSCLTTEQIIEKSRALNRGAKAMARVGLKIFQRYEQKRQAKGLLDFDQLIIEAIEQIHESQGDCSINGIGRIKELRYLLVDEAQDLSPFFFALIQSVRKYSPNLRIFTAGDSKQSIFSFAGSDLRYFNDFDTFFEDVAVCHLTMNFRSREQIVKNANKQFLDDKPMRYMAREDKGVVENIDLDRASLRAIANTCIEIIQRTQCKDTLILSRINRIHGVNIDGFKDLIFSQLAIAGQPSEKNIRVQTVHSAKGGEADTVIILKGRNSFPLIHPDSDLFELFSADSDSIIDEERRLWYVAITRAKNQLFILNTG